MKDLFLQIIINKKFKNKLLTFIELFYSFEKLICLYKIILIVRELWRINNN